MDNTTVNSVNNQVSIYSPGSLFINDKTDDIFILFHSLEENGFYAVSLQNGDTWDSRKTTAERAVDGLRFLGAGLRIIVADPKYY